MLLEFAFKNIHCMHTFSLIIISYETELEFETTKLKIIKTTKKIHTYLENFGARCF